MLQNADPGTLTVHQIAAHLDTRPGNITRELQLGGLGQPGRLRGTKTKGAGVRGRGGQWRVQRQDYLDWLGMPGEDRQHLGPDGLPLIYPIWSAAIVLSRRPETIRALLPRAPHLVVGRQQYLTHHQLERLSALLAEQDCRDKPR